jgi:hypothetical protein
MKRKSIRARLSRESLHGCDRLRLFAVNFASEFFAEKHNAKAEIFPAATRFNTAEFPLVL